MIGRWLFGRVLIPAFESGLKRRSTFAYWRELEQTQWLSREELEQGQTTALRRLITHAADNCPYYRDAWRSAGLDARSIQSPADFESWPVVDRDTIREHRLRMRSSLAGALISKATGGSSGVPLQFDLNPDSNDRRMAAWHRGYGWAGAAPGTRQLYLWGVALGGQSSWGRWKDRFYNALYRRKILNCFRLSEATTSEFLAALSRNRPEVVVAYTNPIYSFARMLDERGLRPFSPRSIVVGAEKLHDFQRETIERVFRAPVFETYGSREFMLIGAECEEHTGLHLTMESLLVEVLDDHGRPTPDGDEGNVVITDLYNYGMPFVRYANGDRAVAGWKMCPCGRGLPLLTKVIGRRLDVLTTSDGRHVPGEFFPHLLKEFAAIRRFQVVQDRPDHVELRLVVRDDWRAEDASRLRTETAEVFGGATSFDLVVVDDIPLTAAGKLRVVVNRCAGQESPAAASQ